jgi:hypothetical protein
MSITLHFKSTVGNTCYRTIRDADKVDANSTHVFRELNRDGQFITRARRLTGEGPWAAANYMRAVITRGGTIELLGTPTGISIND